jgi:hypothetical protein
MGDSIFQDARQLIDLATGMAASVAPGKYHSSFNDRVYRLIYSIYAGSNHFDPALAHPSTTTTPLPSNLAIGEDSDTDEDNELPPPPKKEANRKRKATANAKTMDGAPNKRKKTVNTAAASKGKKKATSK